MAVLGGGANYHGSKMWRGLLYLFHDPTDDISSYANLDLF
jgi:hypothetical protein